MLKTFKIIAILEGISYIVLFSNMLFIKPNDFVLYHKLLIDYIILNAVDGAT